MARHDGNDKDMNQGIQLYVTALSTEIKPSKRQLIPFIMHCIDYLEDNEPPHLIIQDAHFSRRMRLQRVVCKAGVRGNCNFV